MLTSLRMKGYRGFRDYGVEGLAHVNLLVGRNNCGKTSILEAVHLLASGADPEVLAQIAERRGEVVAASSSHEGYRSDGPPTPTCVHFFHGHEFGPDSEFRIHGSDHREEAVVQVKTIADLDQQQQQLFADYDKDLLQPPLVMVTTGRHDGSLTEPLAVTLTDEGALSQRPTVRYGRLRRARTEPLPPVEFISPDSLMPRSMSAMWNSVLTDGKESDVIAAMRILEPAIENIFFLSGATPYRFGGRSGILVAFRGTKRREPLGSHGDGMRRLLAIALALSQARGGILLIDEIDTGLHYSVMGDMWRLVVETAQQSDVQVFATTHSLDCVRGLAWLCDNYPALAKEVSVQKIEPTLEESVTLDAGELMVAVDQEIEVR